jgi:hypothetical protein
VGLPVVDVDVDVGGGVVVVEATVVAPTVVAAVVEAVVVRFDVDTFDDPQPAIPNAATTTSPTAPRNLFELTPAVPTAQPVVCASLPAPRRQIRLAGSVTLSPDACAGRLAAIPGDVAHDRHGGGVAYLEGRR